MGKDKSKRRLECERKSVDMELASGSYITPAQAGWRGITKPTQPRATILPVGVGGFAVMERLNLENGLQCPPGGCSCNASEDAFDLASVPASLTDTIWPCKLQALRDPDHSYWETWCQTTWTETEGTWPGWAAHRFAASV